MTVVVGFTSSWDAFVLADCRLTSVADGEVRRGDVCQKIVMANAWSAVGFAGDLCLGRHLLNGVVNRLRETPVGEPGWLADDGALLRFAARGVRNHAARFGPRHFACQRGAARLLIAWVDHSRSIVPPAAEGGPAPFVPGAEIAVVEVPEMRVRRTRLGLDAVGSGGRIAPAMRDEAFQLIWTYGRYGEGDPTVMEAHRALIATKVVRDLLADEGGDPGVGGLFQIVTLNDRSVRSVPYFYLADVEPGFRTYVAMRPVDGEYVQEHRPTELRVPVVSPFAIDPFAPPGQHEMFDPAIVLTRHSPGVIPARSQELVFQLYDPDDFPAAIRESWGNEPLEPATWLADEAAASWTRVRPGPPG